MPRLLDLFCCAGGCGAGYHAAGFDVVGVDIRPQPRYPFEFHQGDALDYLREHGGGFDAVHASPPCQSHSKATAWRGRRSDYPDLVPATRAALQSLGRPYVIENVADTGHVVLHFPLLLCGTMFGLPVRRHRVFESSVLLMQPGPCCHRPGDMSFDHGGKQPESAYRDAMGVGWMSVMESRQAVPPAYTECIGRQLLATLAGETQGGGE